MHLARCPKRVRRIKLKLHMKRVLVMLKTIIMEKAKRASGSQRVKKCRYEDMKAKDMESFVMEMDVDDLRNADQRR